MGCCTGSKNYHSPNMPLGGTFNLNQCEGVRVELLNEWLYKLKRVKQFSSWVQAGIEEAELIDRINVLEQWIVVKKIDSATCEYFDQLKSFQTMIVKIIKSGAAS